MNPAFQEYPKWVEPKGSPGLVVMSKEEEVRVMGAKAPPKPAEPEKPAPPTETASEAPAAPAAPANPSAPAAPKAKRGPKKK